MGVGVSVGVGMVYDRLISHPPAFTSHTHHFDDRGSSVLFYISLSPARAIARQLFLFYTLGYVVMKTREISIEIC